MVIMQYSPKEIAILDSVLELFSRGTPLHVMKIADIAAGAGIGKGTVYEYFSSKEEIIGKAVAYQILKEIQEISVEIAKNEDFKECTFGILTKISACHNNESSPFILMRQEFTEIDEVQAIFKELEKTYKQIEKELTIKYLNIGVKAGLICEESAKSIGQQVVLGALAGFHLLLHHESEASIEQLMENTFTIIIKSLQ